MHTTLFLRVRVLSAAPTWLYLLGTMQQAVGPVRLTGTNRQQATGSAVRGGSESQTSCKS